MAVRAFALLKKMRSSSHEEKQNTYGLRVTEREVSTMEVRADSVGNLGARDALE